MSNLVTKRLEEEKIGPLLLSYALPAVVGTMVNALYNIVDRIFIGQGVGSLAISGLTLTFPVLLLLQAFGMLVGSGSAARVSIYLGMKERDLAENVLGNALMLTFIFSSVMITAAMVFLDDILLWFGGNELIIPYAKDYLYIAIPGNFLAALSFGFNAIMRASGYPKKAMMTMMIGAILNVILDPIFIFVFDMGIQGAAIATVISMAASATFVMSHFIRKDSVIRFRKKYFTLDKPIILAILTIGVSPFSMQVAASMVNVILNNSLQTYGGHLAIGANGIINSIAMLLVMLIMGITQGMQPIVGYNYGAGLKDRVVETLKLVLVTATAISGVGFLVCFFFPEIIVRAFTSDPELMSISSNGLHITLSAFFLIGSQIVIAQFFQSIGVAWKAMFLSLSRQFLFLIPSILFLPPFWGLDGVWYASPISDTIAAIVAWSFLWYHVKSMEKVSE